MPLFLPGTARHRAGLSKNVEAGRRARAPSFAVAWRAFLNSFFSCVVIKHRTHRNPLRSPIRPHAQFRDVRVTNPFAALRLLPLRRSLTGIGGDFKDETFSTHRFFQASFLRLQPDAVASFAQIGERLEAAGQDIVFCCLIGIIPKRASLLAVRVSSSTFFPSRLEEIDNRVHRTSTPRVCPLDQFLAVLACAV